MRRRCLMVVGVAFTCVCECVCVCVCVCVCARAHAWGPILFATMRDVAEERRDNSVIQALKGQQGAGRHRNQSALPTPRGCPVRPGAHPTAGR
jgi:hypothetical protein